MIIILNKRNVYKLIINSYNLMLFKNIIGQHGKWAIFPDRLQIMYPVLNVVHRGSSNGVSRKRQRIFALTKTTAIPGPANVPCAMLVA